LALVGTPPKSPVTGGTGPGADTGSSTGPGGIADGDRGTRGRRREDRGGAGVRSLGGAATLTAVVALGSLVVSSGPVAAKSDDRRTRGLDPLARVDRVTVPAGPFIQGSTQGEEDERPVRSRVLPAFAIDRTEVTRAAYAACVAARRCKPVPPEAAGPEGADGALPVTGVSWEDARRFCRFTGGRLPTEAEWEKAARGSDGREYPWGNEPTCENANWGNFDGEGPCAQGSAQGSPQGNPGYPVSVGRYPAGASPYGALDMAGNVWEWVADKYDEDPSRRVVRGGSCCSYFVRPRAANRNAWSPDHRDGDLGFRCAAAR
jgi:formylglycine-generating enzyme required for sulfatase activity